MVDDRRQAPMHITRDGRGAKFGAVVVSSIINGYFLYDELLLIVAVFPHGAHLSLCIGYLQIQRLE